MKILLISFFCLTQFAFSNEFNYSEFQSVSPDEFKKVVLENTKNGNGPSLYQKKIELQISLKELPLMVTAKEKKIINSIVSAGNLNADNAKYFSYYFRTSTKDQNFLFILEGTLLREVYEYIKLNDKPYLYASFVNHSNKNNESTLILNAFKTEDEKAGKVPDDPAIITAIRDEDFEKVKILLKSKENLEVKTRTGETPLIASTKIRDIRIAKYLIKKGADPNILDNKNDSALLLASSNGHLELVKLLTEKGATLDSVNYFNLTPLMGAVWNGNLDVAEFLIGAGASTKILSLTNYNLLHLSVFSKNLDMVKLCLKKKFDINSKDYLGRTPLIHSIVIENEEIGNLLLDAGANFTEPDSINESPFSYTAALGVHGITKRLLKMGVNINKKGANGNTALHWAVLNSEITMVKLLVDANATLDISNDDKKTPMQIAKEKNYFLIETMLNK